MRSTDKLFYRLPDRVYTIGATGACLLSKKSTFTALNGFDEDLFPIAFNDVDYCLKLLKANMRIIVHTDISHIHHESISRHDEGVLGVSDDERRSFSLLMKKWKPFLESVQHHYPKNDLPIEILKSWRPDR